MTFRIVTAAMWLGSVSALSLAAAAPASAQAAAGQKSYSVPAQPLGSALSSFAEQSGIDIVFAPETVRGRQSAPLQGSYTPSAGLERLLQGTGLVFRRQPSGTIVVERGGEAGAMMGEAGAGMSPAAAESGDIVVTANKYSQRLIDVPSAVTALRADRLTTSGAVRLEDYAAAAPGVSISNNTTGGVQTQIVFRGLSTGGGGNPVAAVYVDDAPITSASQLGGGGSFPDFDPADLERIEFLRGPQGTLYGAASLGGLLKFVTRKPDFDRLSGRAEMDFAGVDHGGAGAAARASINLPLGTNVALRASGFYRLDPGFIDNIETGKSNENETRTRGGRIALALRPAEGVTVQASILHQAIDSDSVSTIDTDVDGNPLYGDLNVARPRGVAALHERFTLYDLAAKASFHGFDLLSDSSYGVQNSGTHIDYTKLVGGLVDMLAGQPAGTLGVDIYQPFRTRKFTQEVRAQSTARGFLQWQVGGFYTHEKSGVLVEATPVLQPSGYAAPASFNLPNLGAGDVKATYQEIAGFGTVTLNVTSKLSLAGGLRYSHIKLTNSQTLSGLLLGNSSAGGRSSDDKLTFSVNPSYKVTPDMMVYARVASGYRPGGPNITTSDPASYAPDTAVSYEFGAKGKVFDRLITYDLAAFLVDWDNIQIQQQKLGPGGITLSFIDNVGKARSKGIEAAITIAPYAGLTFDVNAAYTDAYFRATTSVAGPGDRLPNAAKFSGQIGGEYRFGLRDDWQAFFGGSVRHVGKRLGEFTALGAPRFVLPHYETIDLRTGIDKAGLEISLYLRNLADKRAYTGVFVPGPYATVGLLQPRTIGLRVAKAF